MPDVSKPQACRLCALLHMQSTSHVDLLVLVVMVGCQGTSSSGP